jgi:hypothetical protein
MASIMKPFFYGFAHKLKPKPGPEYFDESKSLP